MAESEHGLDSLAEATAQANQIRCQRFGRMPGINVKAVEHLHLNMHKLYKESVSLSQLYLVVIHISERVICHV